MRHNNADDILTDLIAGGLSFINANADDQAQDLDFHINMLQEKHVNDVGLDSLSSFWVMRENEEGENILSLGPKAMVDILEFWTALSFMFYGEESEITQSLTDKLFMFDNSLREMKEENPLPREEYRSRFNNEGSILISFPHARALIDPFNHNNDHPISFDFVRLSLENIFSLYKSAGEICGVTDDLKSFFLEVEQNYFEEFHDRRDAYEQRLQARDEAQINEIENDFVMRDLENQFARVGIVRGREEEGEQEENPAKRSKRGNDNRPAREIEGPEGDQLGRDRERGGINH